jgi:hypothetical protein
MILQSTGTDNIEYALDDIQLADALAGLAITDSSLALNQSLTLAQIYWLKIAPPDELADFIVRQPNHTWNGLTIYPGEAWRYRHTDLWITWRGNQHEVVRKLTLAKQGLLSDWDDDVLM